MSITINLPGLDEPVDVNDDDTILAYCEVAGAGSLKRIEPNNHTRALKSLLTGLHYWLIKNGAQLAGASLGGHEGIGLASALSSHNFIASVVGERPLVLPDPVEPELEPESRLVDSQGRPIPPGQLDLVETEGSEL